MDTQEQDYSDFCFHEIRAENAALLCRAEKAEAALREANDKCGSCMSRAESQSMADLEELRKVRAELALHKEALRVLNK